MTVRIKETTPFQSGQQTNARGKADSVKIKSNMSKQKNSGNADGLHTALGHRGPPLLPGDNHIVHYTTTVTPTGARYEPRGEFGHVEREGEGHGVYSYGGAPDHQGEDALGKALNKVGQKSGYPSKGKPSGGGGKHV